MHKYNQLIVYFLSDMYWTSIQRGHNSRLYLVFLVEDINRYRIEADNLLTEIKHIVLYCVPYHH